MAINAQKLLHRKQTLFALLLFGALLLLRCLRDTNKHTFLQKKLLSDSTLSLSSIPLFHTHTPLFLPCGQDCMALEICKFDMSLVGSKSVYFIVMRSQLLLLCYAACLVIFMYVLESLCVSQYRISFWQYKKP